MVVAGVISVSCAERASRTDRTLSRKEWVIMPTIDELGKEYAQQYSGRPRAQEVAEQVARKIKGLTYTGTGRPLTDEDVRRIVEQIGKNLPRIRLDDGRVYAGDDSTDFINMIKKELDK